MTVPTVRIRPARPHEGERLREVAIASKSYWGYDPERVRQWATSGDFSPEWLRVTEVYVAEADEQAIAWTALIRKGDATRSSGRDSSGGSAWNGRPSRTPSASTRGWAVAYLRESEPSEWGRVLAVMGIDLTQPPRA